MMRSAAILLAAGASTRTSLPKQLRHVGGRALVQYQVEALLNRGVERVYVVLGHHAEAVEAALRPAPEMRIVYNPDYEAGMFSSVLAGVAAAKGEGMLFIHPVDVPVPGREVFEALLRAEAPVALPLYEGRGGHPVRLDAAAAETLLRSDATRLDRWLADRREQTAFVPVADARVVMNANTDAALEASFGQDTAKETQ